VRGAFETKQQLFQTSSPDIADGGGIETETDVQSGQLALGFPTGSRGYVRYLKEHSCRIAWGWGAGGGGGQDRRWGCRAFPRKGQATGCGGSGSSLKIPEAGSGLLRGFSRVYKKKTQFFKVWRRQDLAQALGAKLTDRVASLIRKRSPP